MELTHDLLQSHAWEQFQCALGRKTWRVGGTLVIGVPLTLGRAFLYSPRGSFLRRGDPSWSPFRTGGDKAPPLSIAADTETIVHESGAVFWRAECVESQISPPKAPCPSFGGDAPQAQNLKFSTSPPRVLRRAVEPEWTWRVSLEPDEDAMLAGMHEKHRYNVRLAQRRGVRVSQCVSESVSQEHCNTFWVLLQDTAKRRGIGTHPRGYYEIMLRTLSCAEAPSTKHQAPSDTTCCLYLAEREGVPCAAAIVAYHGDTATYLHGGSSHAQRQYMAPHLLHWQAMRDAKHAGMRWYDFGGIEKQEGGEHEDNITENHTERSTERQAHKEPNGGRSGSPFSCSPVLRSAWSGMTRFKQGFGGEAVHHPPMCDLVFRRGWYTILATLARIRLRA